VTPDGAWDWSVPDGPACHTRLMGRRLIRAVVAPALVAVLVGCGDDGVDADAERFCGEARDRRDTIVAPPMANQAELDASLQFFRLMGELAPLEIAEQWNELVLAMETASTVVPGDADSEQRAAIQAYAAERSAYEVAVWLKRYCAIDIPLTTIAPQDPIPARTTTTTSAAPVAGATVPGTTTPP
jgi:hypothetical protein